MVGCLRWPGGAGTSLLKYGGRKQSAYFLKEARFGYDGNPGEGEGCDKPELDLERTFGDYHDISGKTGGLFCQKAFGFTGPLPTYRSWHPAGKSIYYQQPHVWVVPQNLFGGLDVADNQDIVDQRL
jgi:hypothetical protein